MARRTVVIDACCLLNLLATGREIAIVEALGWRLVTSEMAEAEVRFLSSWPDEDGLRARAPANLNPLLEGGLLMLRGVDDSWVDAFVACAAHLTDADASCVALAGALGLPLLTDDGKERRVFVEVFGSGTMLSTLEALEEAIRVLQLGEEEAARIAQDLRWRGNFLPPRRSPHRAWYERLLQR